MILRNLRLVNFRRYTDSFFEFNDRINFINGDNGSGKTSVLEAVHYLSLTKSFRTNNDFESVNYAADFFSIFGEFSDNDGQKNLFNMNFTKSDGRSFLLNKARVKKYTEIVGYTPVVILSPGLQKITEGGPSERRNFVNRIISQIDKEYFLNLIEYKKRLSQRNAVLSIYRDKNKRNYDTYFETQDEILAKVGKQIFIKQESFFKSFVPLLQDVFLRINHNSGSVDISNRQNIRNNGDDYYENFCKSLRERFQRDVQNGRTSCGPHLNDITILYNGREIRQIGSQGEHKLMLIALKLSEGIYLESRKGEPIIYLLDDLFAFLDSKHCLKIVAEIGCENQTLITSTDIREIDKYSFRKNLNDVKIINLNAGEA